MTAATRVDKDWQVKDFQYKLPEELIAMQPAARRTQSRLMVIDNAGIQHLPSFDRLLTQISLKDHVIFNDTRVFKARLFGQKESGGKIEILIERVIAKNMALVHLKSNRSPKPGSVLLIAGQRAQVTHREGDLFCLAFPENSDVFEISNSFGHLPLPPYIARDPEAEDYQRYQTVFAEKLGSVAAPTAGLHFDEALLSAIRAMGVRISFITLHVGAGTFQPVRVASLAQHKMHSEVIEVPPHVCEEIEATKTRGGQNIAIGTTVVRALESAARAGVLKPFRGETDIFIKPGYEFQVVDGMVTNFHLPGSTLLMLVAAFAGYDVMRQAYAEAIEKRYRFFSYGDAMFIKRKASAI